MLNNNAEQYKGQKSGLARLRKALGYSIDGIRGALQEAAFRELLCLHGVLLALLIFLPFPLPEKMLLVLASGASLVTELLNTALEAAVDHTSLEIHPPAKRAKDAGSAAQLVALLLVGVFWLMAFNTL